MTIWKPHLSVIAIHIPAKPIMEPIDKSNSPAIINKPAPNAIIPSWAIILRLFLIPKALRPSPSNKFQVFAFSGIEKKPG